MDQRIMVSQSDGDSINEATIQNPTSRHVYSVTYQRQDQLDVAEIVEDFMQTSMIARSLVALIVVPISVYWIPSTMTFDALLTISHRSGGNALFNMVALFVLWFLALRWCVDPIYWSFTRRFWLPVGTTMTIEVTEAGVSVAQPKLCEARLNWGDLESVALRSAGIVVRLKRNRTAALAPRGWRRVTKRLWGGPYLWLPTRLFFNLDAQQTLCDYLRTHIPDGAKNLPTWYFKPIISGFLFAFSILSCVAVPSRLKVDRRPPSVYARGLEYLSGQGEKQDTATGVKLIRQAADQGYAEAQVELGYLYQTGIGLPYDDAQAAVWYQKAAEAEATDYRSRQVAGNNAVVLFLDGIGPPITEAQARKWIVSSTAHNLGAAYKHGWILQQSDWEADMWLGRAAAHGNTLSDNELEFLTPDGLPLHLSICKVPCIPATGRRYR